MPEFIISDKKRRRDLDRRAFLKLAVGSTPIIAGCASNPGQESTTETPTDIHTATTTVTGSPIDSASPTETEEPTPTPRENPNTIFVATEGDDDTAGTELEPLASIQKALDRAQPGETIRVCSGEYRDVFTTKRPGDPDNPITITGPPDAVIRPPADLPESRIFAITHSHVHLDGMTFDGLANPAKPEEPESYANNVIDAFPPQWQDDHPDYLTDIKIKPDAIGNARRHILGTVRTNNLEIGEFRIIGPAGTENLYGESVDHPSGGIVAKNHIGEMMQIGVKQNVFDEGEGEWYGWDSPDESHDIHIHHIDNSTGHAHTELVEVGTSVYDAVIEYCTDAGQSGKYFISQDHANWTETAMGLRGGRCTLRWCVIENGYGSGVQIGTPTGLDRNLDKYNHIPDDRFPGTNNSVYGNRIMDNAGLAIAFPYVLYEGDEIEAGPDAQKTICGNEYNGDTQADPDKPCPKAIPETDSIGHLGGDSPWG